MMDTVVRAMNGAELKATMGALGVPPSWLAQHLHVTMRTVVRWFDTDVLSPQVVSAVDELRTLTDAEMDRMRKGIDKRRNVVELKTYRTDEDVPSSIADLPATWHRQMVYRLMEELRAEGKTVTVRYA